MRLTLPKSIARFGEIEIRGVQQVLELEAHQRAGSNLGQVNNKFHDCCDHYDQTHDDTQAVYAADLEAVQARTAIVVPCKDESIDRMRGVWAAIPASSLIIVVSGSTTEAYAEERSALEAFCAVTRRNGMCVHQRDPRLAATLREVGMDALLDDDGLVYKGKGEGMVIATMLAATARGPTCQNGTVASGATDRQRGPGSVDNNTEMKDTSTTTQGDDGCLYTATHGNVQLACACRPRETASASAAPSCVNGVEAQSRRQPTLKLPGYYSYIGFIDADNYVPGSVQEYCRAFSAGLALADADDAMVRINWASKPKVQDGKLEFKLSGRSSQILNLWLNRLLRNVGARVTGEYFAADEAEEDEADDGETKRGPDHICTGNAGEHAMSMSLALKLRLANGYAIEPFHFLDILERMVGETSTPATNGLGQEDESKRGVSGYMGPSTPASISPLSSPLLSSVILPSDLVPYGHKTPPRHCFAPSIGRGSPGLSGDHKPMPSPITLRPLDEAVTPDITDMTPPVSPAFPCSEIVPAKVQIFQVRTLNPHFHDNKGDAHVVRMWQQGLSAIYYSPLTAKLLRYRHDLRTVIFAGHSVHKAAADLPTPPATNCASVAVTPPDVSAEEEDRGINGAAVEAAASWLPDKCRIYPAPGSVDLVALRNKLEAGGGSFWSSTGVYGP